MAHGVWADVFGDAGQEGVAGNDTLDTANG